MIAIMMLTTHDMLVDDIASMINKIGEAVGGDVANLKVGIYDFEGNKLDEIG
jgi:SepF-like predicted cell division protein (DUF552 family)